MRSRPIPCLFTLAAITVAGVLARAEAPKQPRPDTTLLSADQKPLGPAERVTRGVSVLQPVGDNSVQGTIFFEETRKGTRITGKVSGLKPGKHGFHVHQFGDVTSAKDGESAGGHFNPTKMPHGNPHDQQRHAGDFGNIEANEQGVAMIDMVDPVVRLNGPHSILGRGLIVHADADQFSQPSGNAGARVAMGVIGVANPKTKPADSAVGGAGG